MADVINLHGQRLQRAVDEVTARRKAKAKALAKKANSGLPTVEQHDERCFISACIGGHFTVYRRGMKGEEFSNFISAARRALSDPLSLVYAVSPPPESMTILLPRDRWPHYYQLMTKK